LGGRLALPLLLVSNNIIKRIQNYWLGHSPAHHPGVGQFKGGFVRRKLSEAEENLDWRVVDGGQARG